MSKGSWNKNKLISRNDIPKLSDFARYMVTNLGYYFQDKKTNKKIDKWEIHNTFRGKVLEDIYAGIHNRYERIKK